MSPRRLAFLAALSAASFATTPALALSVDVSDSGPSVVGEAHAFSAVVSDPNGAVTFAWTFGETAAPLAGPADASHVFTAPGHYSITVEVTDGAGDSASWTFQHMVHNPLTNGRPTSSTSIIYDSVRKRVYSANQDNDTITSVDAETLTKLAELPVYRRPESLALTPQGKLWVVHKDDYAVAVVEPDRFAVEGGFRLPYASQPVAVAMSPVGDAAYVSLMALGKLLKLDPGTGAVLAECEVGPRPRGIAVSHDGRDVYVTRFISADTEGEVVKLDTALMQVSGRIALPLDTATTDGPQAARGLPNYLFSVALTPDGRQAWVPAKKDNILRGTFRDGQALTHDTTVRPLVSILDVQRAQERVESRIDLDNRSPPLHVEFTPFGDLAIITLGGSNRVEIRDVNLPNQVFSAIADAGKFPRATVLAPNKRLFVQGALSRDILVYNLSAALDYYDKSSPSLLETIPAVEHEALPPEVLAGKKIFHDSEDLRMTSEGYVSCGACHFEGGDDGRVWDFGDRGEGLRNTMAMLGRGGTRHGGLNWSANLDEVQDFEHLIRTLFLGKGFMADADFNVGTRNQPLGDTKAGVSTELDALAAYVASLDHVNPSPYRNPDGSLTADGLAGQALFAKLGCDFCHGGSAFTDSMRSSLHDVGTLTKASGKRAGEPLFGIDTPTLLGVWETAPYLHDGSAPTLRDVLITKNPDGLHGYVAALSPEALDQLAAYLLQIDGEPPVQRLPFDPPPSSGGVAGAGGSPSAGAGAVPTGGVGAGGSSGAAQPNPATSSASSGDASGCTCRVRRRRDAGLLLSDLADALACLGLLAVGSARRRWRARTARSKLLTCEARRSSKPFVALLPLLVVALAASGCGSPDAASGAPGTALGGMGGTASTGGAASTSGSDWSLLPPLTAPDPELAALGLRGPTYQRVCARGRGDSFATALCRGAQRPELPDLAALLRLAGLAEQRAFALTANSTSLVSTNVSAINPRVVVFPRVGGDEARLSSMTAVGFVRGEQFVEVVSRDLVTDDFNFYLVYFEQRCSYEASGCDLASLLTEEIEHGWTAFSVYDQDDLEQTSLDCLSCHQPGGHGTRRLLRMQELTSPWMHWFPQRFAQRTESDRVLGQHFAETHELEGQYGAIPMPVILNALDEGSGAQLEALVRSEGFAEQPNPFDAQIATEMLSGVSPTWQARFDAHLRGEAIAVPYPALDVTDEAKRAAAVRSYREVVQGAAPRQSLLDMRRIFSADAEQKLSLVPQPGAEGKTVLLQMCARCHDGRGNPALPKNLFNVLRLDQMPRELKDAAIARLSAVPLVMPPPRAGQLTPAAIQAATLELQK